jgi:hypothetical protein
MNESVAKLQFCNRLEFKEEHDGRIQNAPGRSLAKVTDFCNRLEFKEEHDGRVQDAPGRSLGSEHGDPQTEPGDLYLGKRVGL